MSDEFRKAVEESAKRLGMNIHKLKITVADLRPGDLLYHPEAGYHLFVCRGSHPIWPNLQAVVWCDSDGKLSIDALSITQELHGMLSNKEESPVERAQRFRSWYLERRQ